MRGDARLRGGHGRDKGEIIKAGMPGEIFTRPKQERTFLKRVLLRA